MHFANTTSLKTVSDGGGMRNKRHPKDKWPAFVVSPLRRALIGLCNYEEDGVARIAMCFFYYGGSGALGRTNEDHWSSSA